MAVRTTRRTWITAAWALSQPRQSIWAIRIGQQLLQQRLSVLGGTRAD